MIVEVIAHKLKRESEIRIRVGPHLGDNKYIRIIAIMAGTVGNVPKTPEYAILVQQEIKITQMRKG